VSLLNNIVELNNGRVSSEIIWDDARRIMKGKSLECGRINKESAQILESNSVDLVLTSPPYLTAQKYIRTNKLELFCLGYNENEVSNLDKSSIGTERVSVATKISSLDIKTIDREIESVSFFSRKRAVQVFQYFDDMVKSLAEIKRVLRKGSYAIIVVGDNRVLHNRMKTYRCLAEAAIEIGLKEVVTLKDTIRSRSMLTKRNGTGGIIKEEYVIVLKKV
jgi:DNA modification methylase